MNKIIFISHDPLTEAVEKHFYLNKFLQDGIAIEYWCVRKLLCYAKKIHLSNEITTAYYKEFSTFPEFKMLLQQQPKDCWFCVEVWFNWDTIKIYKALRPFPLKFSIDWYCNIPAMPRKKKIMDDLKTGNIIRLLNGMKRAISRMVFTEYGKLSNLAAPALFFVPGKRSTIAFKHRNVIPLNHHDFEIFIASQYAPPFKIDNETRYAVFLDVMLPFHPDFKRVRSKTIDYKNYFSKINKFFTRLEQILDLPVIIAAHPKSNYVSEFEDRLVIKGRTNDLVKGSSLVIAHHSAAINFAVLSKKKLALIYTNEFQHASAGNFILQQIYYTILLYSQLLNCSSLNIDHIGEHRFNINEVDPIAYDQFINDYIVGNPSISNYETITHALTTYVAASVSASIPGKATF